MDKVRELEQLAAISEALGVSEYKLFIEAYRVWFGQHPKTRFVDRQFGDYLKSGKPPFYVRHFVRSFEEHYPEYRAALRADHGRQERVRLLTTAALVVAVAVALALG